MHDTESSPQTTDTRSSRRRWLIPAILGAILIVAAAGAYIALFAGDDPEEVSLEAAVAAATSSTAVEEPADPEPTTTAAAETSAPAETTTTTEAASPEGIDGTWTIDTTIGTFDFESATGSFAGFRIGETLGQGIGETEAVGRTGAVFGTLEIAGSQVTAVNVEADLSQLTTDLSQRDSRARGALSTDEFPLATFELTEPIDLPEGADSGEPIMTTATGELTIAGTTNPVTLDVEAQLVDDIIVVVASTEVTFADYGVEVPSAGIVLAVDDFGVVEMQLLFTRS